nr:hypothetical protein [Tanacetum cinerariifolium]
MIDSQMDDMIKEKLALKEQVDSLEKNLSNLIKEKECLVVHVFSLGDYLIACLNKAIAFLTVVAFLRRDKGKVIIVLVIRVTLLVLREIMQVDSQGLLNATTVKVKDIWLGNALSLSIQTEDLDAYDSDYADIPNAKAILTANTSNYGSDVISK